MAENTNIVLRAENITKVFGGLRAVDNMSLYLKEQEILALIGANGAGKTTMFNCISGELQLTSGVVYIGDTKILKPVPHKMAALGLARTYQVVRPFGSMTALENTMVGAFKKYHKASAAREKAMSVLEELQIAHKANALGKDLALIDLKRLEVARALALEPKILLLDEVMAGLNPTESEVVMQMIWDIQKRGVSIILIEHVMRAVMALSERIYVMNQGKLLAEGKPAEIANNEQVIESYLGRKKHA